jgi:hypothetical protein
MTEALTSLASMDFRTTQRYVSPASSLLPDHVKRYFVPRLAATYLYTTDIPITDAKEILT